ncbi:MAG: hypothetical protein FWC97_02235 [Treponema sp.]|nr:hypothetical protein [Treponema sp.]
MKNIFGIICVFPAVLLLGCLELGSGKDPTQVFPAIPPKVLMGTSGPTAHPVGVVLHIDVEKFNPLNAKDYFIRDRFNPDVNIQFFDTVILSFAYMEKLPRGTARLRVTPALQYILDNSDIYIRPLRARGIRVLVEVRSGNYSDSEPGSGFGFGTMEIAAIIPSLQDFTQLVERYEIDGFELNDVGGGYKSFPPHTRYLTRFESDELLYPDSLFVDEDGNPLLDYQGNPKDPEKILWQEGAINFVNFIHFLFEELKLDLTMERNFQVMGPDGNMVNDNIRRQIVRTIITRQNGHGTVLSANLRFDPDAYTGATFVVIGNMTFLVQDFTGLPADIPGQFPVMFDERNFGLHWPREIVNTAAERSYVPFILDLSDLLPVWATTAFREFFLGSGLRRYGALYFKNLPPVSETPTETTLSSYLTRFSTPIFGTAVTRTEGGGDYTLSDTLRSIIE